MSISARYIATGFAIWLIALVAVDPAFAQRGRGGSDRGGGDSGGFQRGGFRGGGDSGGFQRGGFRGGGDSGGSGFRGGSGASSGMASFVARLDTNRNGLLDPPEMEGRTRFMLERFASDIPGFSFSRPFPIDRLTRFMEQRQSSGTDRGGRDERDQGRDSGRSGSSRTATVEPLVPGFGVPDAFAPVAGFGTLGEQFAVAIESEDREEAQRTLSRNDRNGDGILDAEEIRRGRWSADPLLQDRNKDGRLTVSELSLRYAMRRTTEEEERSNRSSSDRSRSSRTTSSRSSSNDNSRDSRGSSSGGSDRMSAMVNGMFDRFDQNKSGMLEKDEWSGLQGDASAADTNKDNRLSRDEMAGWLASRFSRGRSGGDERSSRGRSFGGDRGFGGRGGDRGFSRDDEGGGRSRFFNRGERGDGEERGGAGEDPSSNNDDKKQDVATTAAMSYRSRIADRMPEDLPSWFAAQDQNQDGQVMMVEYIVSWTDGAAREFEQFDLNGDGIITAQECLIATENGVVRGGGGGSSFASRSSGRSSRGPSRRGSESAGKSPSTTPASAGAGSDDNTSRYIAYAVKYIKDYDTNGDGVLEAKEWSKMSKDYSAGDADGDGKLTPTELAAQMMKR